MIEFAAVVFLVTALAFAALWWWTRRRLAEARQLRDSAERARGALAAVLDTIPLRRFRWARDGADLPGDGGGTFTDLLASLDPGDADRIAAAVLSLRTGGSPLAATVAAPGGGAYDLEGRSTAHGESVLWLADSSATHRAEAARAAAVASAAGLRDWLDATPVPVWRRDSGLAVVDCNAAYATALDATRAVVLAESREIASASTRDKALALARAAMAAGTPQSESRHVVIAGSRRLLAVTEIPERSGGTIGFALDRTDLESAQGELARHVSAHGVVLESIHAAVAIYGGDKRLKFFNAAFA
ncbi:MAG: hypothetical protein ACREFB_05395, partial [Stellaceae bacterium]